MKEYVDEFLLSYKAHWTSYTYYRRDPFAGKYINIDTNGIRYTPPWRPFAIDGEHVPTVFVFGGSTMWGTGARDSGTIPSEISRLIAADPAKSPVRVLNFGESGYVSTQGVLRLELELRRGNVPDVVIMYDGVNDVFSSYQDGEAGLPQNEMHRATEFNLLKEGGRMRSLGWDDLLGRTVTASVINSFHPAVQATLVSPRTELAADVVRLYRGNLEIVDALSRKFGFRYEAYWQPVVFAKKARTPYERMQSDKLEYVRPYFLDAYRRVGEDAVLRANPRFHNISNIFDNAETPVYLDFCHITETGNAIVAKRIYADVRGLLPQRGR
jgi:lysophospholipase L1-like esterase